jgi:hypothetical protein
MNKIDQFQEDDDARFYSVRLAFLAWVLVTLTICGG